MKIAPSCLGADVFVLSLLSVVRPQMRIQGAVVLQAVISREGTIENLQVLSGHPMLVPSALAAVRQWQSIVRFPMSSTVELSALVPLIPIAFINTFDSGTRPPKRF